MPKIANGELYDFSNNPEVIKENTDICERFRITRIEQGLRQIDYAEMLGVKLSLVKNIERGTCAPSYDVVRRWKKRFHVSYEWILEGKIKGKRLLK